MDTKCQKLKVYGTPKPTSGHSAAVYNGSTYIFGGSLADNVFSNDLYEFDQFQNWKLVDTKGTKPSPRVGHFACVMDDKMYITFGIEAWNSRGPSCCSDLYEFDFKTQTWSLVHASGHIPDKRYNHTAQAKETSIYVFGGLGGGYQCFDDVLEFDAINVEWKLRETSGCKPSKRCGHSAAIWRESMYIFGGVYRGFMNDMYAFHLKTGVWKKIEMSGNIPSARSTHTAVVMNESMFIFGGERKPAYFNDLYCYEFTTKEWKIVNVSGDIPPKRRFHTSVLYNQGMLVFGGRGEERLGDFHFIHLIDLVPKTPSLKNLLQLQNKFGDVLVHVKGKELLVHRCLISQATRFEELIEYTGKKNENGITEITIDDVSPKIFQNVLHYLYSGRVEIESIEECLELISVAKQYAMKSLEILCYAKFLRKLDSNNVLVSLMKAHEYQLPIAKALCYNYIFRHKEQILCKKEELLKLPSTIVQSINNINGMIKVPVNKVFGEQELRRHIKKLYKTKNFSDITLVSKDGEKFRAHRAILVSFSEFFALMLDNTFKESQQDEIIMDNVDGKTLKFILRYVYLRQTSLPSNHIDLMNLIIFSDFAMMKELNHIATQKLLKINSPKNAMEIIQLCIEHNIEGELKKKCLSVIRNTAQHELQDMILENTIKHNMELLKHEKFIQKLKENERKLEDKINELQKQNTEQQEIIKQQEKIIQALEERMKKLEQVIEKK